MELPHEMTTLTYVMEKLRQKKMDTEFRWTPQGFTTSKGKSYQPENLVINKVFRFEGITDPADMSVLYVIEANDGLIGYSLDAYGVYSSHDDEEGYDNFIRLIPERGHEEQRFFQL